MKLKTTLLMIAVMPVLLSSCADEPAETEEVVVDTETVETPELLTRELLFGNPERAQARISHDGRHLSWIAPLDGVLNIWVAPVDAPGEARAVTDDADRGIRNHSWTYSDRHIVYLQDEDGDENWRVHSVDIESGESVDLTPIEGISARIEGVSHKHPEEILVAINDRDERLHDIYRVNLHGGELELVAENPGFADIVTDDDYRVRFGTQMQQDGSTAISQYVDGEWEPYDQIPYEDTLTTSIIGFDQSSEKVLMVDSRGRDTAALTLRDIDSGETEVIFSDDRADVSDALQHPVTREIEAASSNFLRETWTVLDERVQKDFDYLSALNEGEFSVVARTLEDDMWVIAYTLSDAPLSYYVYDREAGEAEFLFTNRPELEDKNLAPMHPLVISARDGLELVSYLTLPVETDPDRSGRPDEPVPMVLFVHGGPWGRDSYGYHSYHQWLANRGYAVLSVNFRGSTGFGKEFINAGDKEWGEAMHDDLIDAVEWAVAQGITERDSVAIMGGSYGGYATLAGLTFTPETFACGVDIVGPSNLITLLESIPPYWAPMIELFAKRVGDHRTEEGRELLRSRSPLTHVERIEKPLLIGQGANDPRVKQAESDQIVEAMQERDIPVTYVLYPDEGHGFARPENSKSFNAVAEGFLGECLGGRVQPIGDDFEGASIQVPVGAGFVNGLEAALDATDGE